MVIPCYSHFFVPWILQTIMKHTVYNILIHPFYNIVIQVVYNVVIHLVYKIVIRPAYNILICPVYDIVKHLVYDIVTHHVYNIQVVGGWVAGSFRKYYHFVAPSQFSCKMECGNNIVYIIS